MSQMVPKQEISRREFRKDAVLKAVAWSSPFAVPIVPAGILFVAGLLLATAPPVMATVMFFAVLWLIVGGFLGLGGTAGILLYRSRWRAQVRERLARRGIMAHEVEWFRSELTGAEKRSLQELSNGNEALADAFRDTLASRLTATRILKSARHEQNLVKRRQSRVRNLKSDNLPALLSELDHDLQKLVEVESRAKSMLDEAETRLQMIEAAYRRGGVLADTELATKTLSMRTAELPLALESARVEDEIRRELEREV